MKTASNIYSEELFQHERVKIDIAFLPNDHNSFIQ